MLRFDISLRMADNSNYIVPVLGLGEATESGPDKVAPREFLDWAEKDLGMNSKRGRGNALSNIKKALDSRLDEIIGKTHLRFTGDWVPRRIDIREKLKIVGK